MGAKDFEITKGDTTNIVLTVQNTSGTGIDITGYTFFFTAKTNNTDADANAVLTKDVTTHTTPASGITAINLTAGSTGSVSPGRYYYDIQMKDTSANITTLISGFLTVNQDITQRTS